MARKVKIKIINEVHVMIVGLRGDHLQHFYDKFAVPVEGFFFNPLYKLGRWDGKSRFFTKDGKTYLYLIDQIIPQLRKFGYDLELEDIRQTAAYFPDPIDDTIFEHILHLNTGKPTILRDYQVDGVNALLEDGSGIVVASTSAGKTLITAAICTAYGNLGLRTLTIVPNRDLIRQTKADYVNCLLDTGEYSGKIKTLDHQHVVSTWQALKNNPLLITTFQVVIVDECLDGGTLITMSDYTTKEIRNINIGDSILSFNHETNTFEEDIVIKQFINMNKSSSEDMYELVFDNGYTVSITGNHPILTDRGFVRADELTELDEIINIGSSNGES
jgi:hypothetical protein